MAALPAGDGVADEHALARVLAHPRHLVAEPRRVGRDQRVPALPRLDVGPAGRGGLDPDERLAGPRHRVGDVDHAQVLVAEQQRGSHGKTTALYTSPDRCASSASPVWSSMNGAAEHQRERRRSGLQERERGAHVRRAGRPARGHPQLAREHGPAVDAEQRVRLRRRVQAQRPARRERLRGLGDRPRALGADHRHVDRLVAVCGGAEVLGGAEPHAVGLAHPHRVDPAGVRGHDREQPGAAGADHEQAVARPQTGAVLRPQRAAERLGERRRRASRSVDRQQLADQLGRDADVLRESARVERGGAERSHSVSWPCRQRRHSPHGAWWWIATRSPTATESPRRRPPRPRRPARGRARPGACGRTYQPTSEPQVAHASTRQTTSPGPQTGSGRSSIRVSPRATVSATLTPPSPPCRPSPAGRRRAR